MRSGLPRQLRSSVREFVADEAGFILPYVAIVLMVLVAFAVLAIEGARLMAAQTELQNAADALALAGAAELDRMPDSALRATNAINNLLHNGWGGGQSVNVAAITFYSRLPANDAADLSGGVPASACAGNATCSTLARFVTVAVAPVTLAHFLPTDLFGGPKTLTTGATAVGGYDQLACKITPAFVCNPFETAGMSYGDATAALLAADDPDPNAIGHRQLIRLTPAQTGTTNYSPGDLGYLNPATGYLPSGQCGPAGDGGIPQAMTSTPAPACFRISSATIANAPDSGALDGLNTRFDIYANGFAGCMSALPDQNVRKGYGHANACGAGPAGTNWPLTSQTSAALPPDASMIAANVGRCAPGVGSAPCLDVSVPLGSGTWDCATYWAQAIRSGTAPPGCTSTASISRLGVYQYEIASGATAARSSGGETGAPVCNPQPTANARIFDAAIINCLSNPAPVAPGATGVPVAAFGKFFMSLPVNTLTNQNLYVEFVTVEKPKGGVIRDAVQLYR